MCGVFGIAVDSEGVQTTNGGLFAGRELPKILAEITRILMELSQRRGSDAAGLMVYNKSKGASTRDELIMFKAPGPAREFLLRPEAKSVINNITNETNIILGHTRAMTKGHFSDNFNNHPILNGDVVGIHNGQIMNDEILWRDVGEKTKRTGVVDSEIIFHLIDLYSSRHDFDIQKAIYMTSTKLSGSYVCGMFHRRKPNYLWTFTNSTAYSTYSTLATGFKIFASEEEFISRALIGAGLSVRQDRFVKVPAKRGIRFDTASGKMHKFLLHSAVGYVD